MDNTPEVQLAEKRAKLAEVNSQIANLKSERPPTTDVEFERDQAVQMMIAEKALSRVKLALELEITKLQSEIYQQQADQNRERINEIIAQVQQAEVHCFSLLEEAYVMAKEVLKANNEYQMLGRPGGKLIDQFNPGVFFKLDGLCMSVETPLIESGRYLLTTAGVIKAMPVQVQARRNQVAKLMSKQNGKF